jgi:hypothetical protein
MPKVFKHKPVTLAEIVAGQPYIHVIVDIQGGLQLETVIFCGRPKKIRYARDEVLQLFWGEWSVFVQSKFEFQDIMRLGHELGLEPSKCYNYHRIFRLNAESQRQLSKIVAEQDLLAYISLISPSPGECANFESTCYSYLSEREVLNGLIDIEDGDAEDDLSDWRYEHDFPNPYSRTYLYL